jgi:hypothetical protein
MPNIKNSHEGLSTVDRLDNDVSGYWKFNAVKE